MRTPKTFLLAFFSPALALEHSRLVEAIQHHSDGDYVEVYKQASTPQKGIPTPFTILYLFTTTKYASEMGFPTLNGDKYFLVEVSPDLQHWHDGLSVAHNWLERHKPAK